MQTIQQEQAMEVIGIELRTSNDEAFNTIPNHWKRFGEDGVAARIPAKLSSDIYAVYTNFQHPGVNNQGTYSLVIGAAVAPGMPVPDGLTRVTMPASRRAVFAVEQGRMDKVGEKWQEIWSRTDLKKTFIAEYERYTEGGGIDIFIGTL